MINNKNQFNFENEIIFDKIKNILEYIFKKKRFNSDSEFDSHSDSEFNSDSEFDSNSEFNSDSDSESKLDKFLKLQDSKKKSKSNKSNGSKKSDISYSNEKITPDDLYLEIKYQLHKKNFIIKYNNKVRNLKFFLKKSGLSLTKFISKYTHFKIIEDNKKLYITA